MRIRASAVRPAEVPKGQTKLKAFTAMKNYLIAPTCKGKTDVIIKHSCLSDCAWVLKLEHTLLFDAKHNGVLALYAHCTCPLVNGLEGILNLEEVPIR